MNGSLQNGGPLSKLLCQGHLSYREQCLLQTAFPVSAFLDLIKACWEKWHPLANWGLGEDHTPILPAVKQIG